LGLAACGGDVPAGTTTVPVDTATSATTVTMGPTTTSESSSTTGPALPLAVEAAGETWEIAAAICSDDPGVRAAAVDAAAAEVEQIVARRVSGWPTTTAVPPGEDRFAEEVRPAGVVAMAVAEAAGLTAALFDRWSRFEAGYADPGQGWGGITEISTLSSEWRDSAAVLAAALPGACAGR
jgi:hypothetical protein